LSGKTYTSATPNFSTIHAIYQSIDFTNEERPAFQIFEKALAGYNLLAEQHDINKQILTIIDFTKSANEKRLWVIDLEKRKLLFHCLTAHGKNSGEIFAHSFSNVHNSNKSSLGFYITGNTYIGKHGTSLKLKGIEPKINDQAEARAIVMHGAEYVSEEHILRYGRLGRSFGCPAIPMSLHKQIIETIDGGTCLFIYHSSQDYHQQSLFANAMSK
jgi:hypothetical protein